MSKKKKKKPKMTSLASAFLDAGVMKEDKAKKLMKQKAHQDRVKGREAQEAEQADKEKAFQEERAKEAERQRQLQAEHDAAQFQEKAQVLVKESELSGWQGTRRFHFITRDRRVPFLTVGRDAQRMLEDGEAAIVEAFGQRREDHLVIRGREAIERLRGLDAGAVRFWNEGDHR